MNAVFVPKAPSLALADHIMLYDHEQGSPEWFKARAGVPTASRFDDVMKAGRGGKPSATRQTYMDELAAEVVRGKPNPDFSNVHTARGHAMEHKARDWYAFYRGADPTKVGFLYNKRVRAGVSPDSIVDGNGMLEIKSKLPKLQMSVLREALAGGGKLYGDLGSESGVVVGGPIPSDHVAQCQGALLVAEREWIDFVSFWPDMARFVTRVYRNEAYLSELKVALDQFNAELDALVSKGK